LVAQQRAGVGETEKAEEKGVPDHPAGGAGVHSAGAKDAATAEHVKLAKEQRAEEQRARLQQHLDAERSHVEALSRSLAATTNEGIRPELEGRLP
jgi:hypothetical protein